MKQILVLQKEVFLSQPGETSAFLQLGNLGPLLPQAGEIWAPAGHRATLVRFHPALYLLWVLRAVGCFRFPVPSWVSSTRKHHRALQLSTKGTA